MFASYAFSIARRSRGFIDGSAPPRRAATVTSLMRRVKVLPFLASAAAFLCFTLAHLECPDMAERHVSSSGKPIILHSDIASSQKKLTVAAPLLVAKSKNAEISL